jgi:hypothetical protein
MVLVLEFALAGRSADGGVRATAARIDEQPAAIAGTR